MKKITLALVITLISFAAGSWKSVIHQMDGWPAWWKILIALAFGCFVAFALLYALDLWSEFLGAVKFL